MIFYIDKDNRVYSCNYNYLECRDGDKIYLSDDFQKYMIDFNDPQLDQHGNIVPLLTNTTFKDQIETRCPDLKDAKYIIDLYFRLDIAELQDKTLPIQE